MSLAVSAVLFLVLHLLRGANVKQPAQMEFHLLNA